MENKQMTNCVNKIELPRQNVKKKKKKTSNNLRR